MSSSDIYQSHTASGEVAIALHPGAFLEQAYLEPLELSVVDAAKALGVTRQTLSALVHGHRSVSTEMALRLERAFGRSAESWLNLQRTFDLNYARQRTDVSQVKTLFEPAHTT